MKIKTVWMILAAVLVMAAGIVAWHNHTQLSAPVATSPAGAQSAASVTDGKQLIEVAVKEGYNPRAVEAKAGVPVVLKMKTEGTYDCSATFMIPELGVRAQMPSSGVTDIDIPAQKAGTNLVGTCGMGMYSLEIKFD